MKDAIWWYANPQNWTSPRTASPGPYSSQSAPPASADRGRQARAELNLTDSLGGLVRVLAFASGRSFLDIAAEAGLHPGRFEDIAHDRTHTTPQERIGIARAFGVDASELDGYARERTG